MKWQYILLVIITAIVASTLTVLAWLTITKNAATQDTTNTSDSEVTESDVPAEDQLTNQSTNDSDTVITGNEDGRSCDQDYDTYCQDTPPGKINLVNCLLNEHYDEISDACRNSLERRQQLNEELVAACEVDRGKFCRGVEPKVGSEPMVDCLEENYDQLSADCAAAFDAHAAAKLTP